MYLDWYAYKGSSSVVFCSQHGFYNVISEIKHKLNIASGRAPALSKEKFWVHAGYPSMFNNLVTHC
jgi:hypothetical protein